MGKVFFWLIWVVELLAFIFLGGCLVLLMSYNGGPGSIKPQQVVAYGMLAATVVLSIYGLMKAFTGFQHGEQPARLGLYLAIAPVAAFVCLGSCALVFNL